MISIPDPGSELGPTFAVCVAQGEPFSQCTDDLGYYLGFYSFPRLHIRSDQILGPSGDIIFSVSQIN